VILVPDQYGKVPVYDLLVAAAKGRIGIDHRFLHAILNRMDEAVGDIVRFGLERREDDPVPLESDLIAICRSRPRPEELPFLIDCVRRRPHDIDDDLLDALLRQGEACVGPLLELYEEIGAEEGGEIAFALAALQVRDERILTALLGRLDADPGDAAFCLSVYGDLAAKPALEEALETTPPSGEHSEWIARSLREAIERLERPEPPSTLDPYDIWLDYPELAPPQFELLTEDEVLEYLSSPLDEHRREAAATFRQAKLPAEAKAVLFDLARRDPDPAVRAACWESLANVEQDEQIHDAMLERVNDPEAPLEERCGALVGLAGDAEDPAVRERILEFYHVPGARAKALEAMWNSMDRSFAGLVTAHLDDPDPAVRRQAILGVGYLQVGAQAGRLIRLFDDEEFRPEALHSFALAAPGEVSRLRMRQLFGKIEELGGGLSEDEAGLVQDALNVRLETHGLEHLSFGDASLEDEPPSPKPGRNDPCPCGSGKKFKKCCGA
jgi:hypothetical protein